MTIKVRIAQLGILFAFVAAWELLTYYNVISPFVLAPPYPTARNLVELFTSQGNSLFPGGLYPQLFITLEEIGAAMAISVVVGIPVGFLIGMRKVVSDLFEPILYVLYAIPMVILYPVIYIVVGIGEPSKIIFGVLLGIFPLTISTVAGLRQIKHQYFRLAKSMGLSSTRTMSKIILPASAPSIANGLRQCLSLVIIGVVGGEILASNGGLGFMIIYTSNLYQFATMYAVLILIIVIAFAFVEGIRIIERRSIPHFV